MAVGDLDWMICNGGADIWQLLPEHDGKETTWVADELWEGHISFRSAHLFHLLRPLRCALHLDRKLIAIVPLPGMKQSRGP